MTRDAQIEAAASIEEEIPAGDPIAIGSFGGRQPEIREPVLDIGRAHAGRARIGG